VYSVLSQYQAILDIATYVSLNKLLAFKFRCRYEQRMERRRMHDLYSILSVSADDIVIDIHYCIIYVLT